MVTVTVPPPTTFLGRLGNEGNILEVRMHSVLLEAQTPDDPLGDQLIRVDRPSGKRHVLARSRFNPGEIDTAATVGDWVIYNDHRGAVTNGDVPYLWRVYALNLRTWQTLVLDGNGNKPDITWVTMRSKAGAVIWARNANFSGPFRVWKPGWRTPRSVSVLPGKYMTYP